MAAGRKSDGVIPFAEIKALAVAIHAAAPDGSAECDAAGGEVTEEIDKVTCPACLALITPWLDGTAEV
jgi:hypothetical protein